MGKRENTGSVAGGMAGRQLPPGLDVGDWSGHAEGRLNAMAPRHWGPQLPPGRGQGAMAVPTASMTGTCLAGLEQRCVLSWTSRPIRRYRSADAR